MLELGLWTHNPATNHYYQPLECGNWEQCEAAAKNLGGHLVTINNATENQWLVDTFGYTPYWIGLIKKEQPKTWQWISGEDTSYTNWLFGQPDGNGDYGWIGLDSSSDGWDDCTVDCYNQYAHQGIVEIDILK